MPVLELFNIFIKFPLGKLIVSLRNYLYTTSQGKYQKKLFIGVFLLLLIFLQNE